MPARAEWKLALRLKKLARETHGRWRRSNISDDAPLDGSRNLVLLRHVAHVSASSRTSPGAATACDREERKKRVESSKHRHGRVQSEDDLHHAVKRNRCSLCCANWGLCIDGVFTRRPTSSSRLSVPRNAQLLLQILMARLRRSHGRTNTIRQSTWFQTLRLPRTEDGAVLATRTPWSFQRPRRNPKEF